MVRIPLYAKIIVPIIIILVAVSITYYLMKNKRKVPRKVSKPVPAMIVVQKINKLALNPVVNLYAKVVSHQEASLSSPYFGKIKKVYVKVGDQVKPGQALIELDTVELSLILKQTIADIQDIASQIKLETLQQDKASALLINDLEVLNNAKEAYVRKKTLFRDKHVAREELDQAESSYHQQILVVKARRYDIKASQEKLNSLQAKKLKHKAIKEKSEKDINDSKINAPFNAKIISVAGVVGERIQSGGELLTLYNPDEIELKVMVPNKYLQAIIQANNRRIKLIANIKLFGQDVKAKLSRVMQHIGDGDIGRDVYFGFIKKNKDVALGDVVPIDIYLPKVSNVYALPRSAFYRSDTIYLLDKNTFKICRS